MKIDQLSFAVDFSQRLKAKSTHWASAHISLAKAICLSNLSVS